MIENQAMDIFRRKYKERSLAQVNFIAVVLNWFCFRIQILLTMPFLRIFFYN